MSKAIRTDTGVIDRIKAVMVAKKLSAAALSERAKIPYRSLQNYLLGKHTIPASAIKKISEALDVGADWILFGRSNLDLLILEDCLVLIDDLRALAKLNPASPESAAMLRSLYEKFYTERFIASPRGKARVEIQLMNNPKRRRKPVR